MEWTDISGMDRKIAQALKRAGVAHPAELAAVEDEADLARRAKLAANVVLALCAEARAKLEQLFAAHGVGGPDALARADPEALARAMGVPAAHLERFITAARAAVGYEPTAPVVAATAAVDAPAPEAEPAAAPDAVLLVETSDRARVRLAGAMREDLQIVTARAMDDADAALARVDGDAVLLQEQQAFAKVRLDGAVLAPLPLFEIADAEGERRVRVARLKEDAPSVAAPPVAAPEPQPARGFGRFLSRRG